MNMALQKCTECGHDVSTYADKCPNCGCPMSVINGAQEDGFVDVVLVKSGQNKLNVIRFVRELSAPSLSLSEATHIVENLPQTIISSTDNATGQNVIKKLSEIGCYAKLETSTSSGTHGKDINNNDIADVESTYLFTKDSPVRCPRCMSNQITTSSRGYSLLWGFLGSGSTVNRCGNCGHTWKP